MKYKLGILGAGNMAEAIVRGILKADRLDADEIIAADISPVRRELFRNELDVKAVEENAEVAEDAETLLLCVKPQQMKAALEGIAKVANPEALMVSIAAGVSTKFIEASLGAHHKWRVIRTMPNTPMLVGEGMVAITSGAHATPEDMTTTRNLFEAAASVVEVTEDKIDAVTAISGSGPAYFFFLVEQMVKAGVELGLAPQQALALASKTALGAATMMTTSADSPHELRRKVTSPAGTTHAAITTMEAGGLPKIVNEAIKAAARRSQELGL